MSDPRHTDSGAGALVLKALLIVLGTVGVWAWAAGQLAGLVFGQAWIDVTPGEMVRVTASLPANLADPKLAWPADVQYELPGPVGIYLCFAVVAGVGIWLGVLGLYWWDRLHGRTRWWRPRRQHHRHRDGASWAGRWELRRLRSRDPKPGRVTLGRFGGRLVAAEAGVSAIVFGPPGSDKTVGVVDPSLMDWTGPAVATSVKLDVYDATADARAKRGRVLIVDPAGLSGRPSVRWTPLTACATWRGAQATAKRIAETDPQMARGQGSGDHLFWVRQAQKLLAVLLYAAGATPERGMRDVVRWVDTRDSTQPWPQHDDGTVYDDGQHEVEKLLTGLDHQQATEAWFAVQSHTPKALDSVYVTAEDLLSVYADERITTFTDTNELDWAAFLAGDHTLYLYAPLHEQRRLRPLFEVLLAELVEYAQEHAARQKHGLLPRPLLLALDEAANMAALGSLPELSATARGMGIHLLTVWQDWAQLQTRYGPEQARTVFNNHRAKLLLPGIGDGELLRYASELVGDRAYTETTLGWDQRSHAQHSNQTSVSYRPLLPVDELRRLPRHTGVLIYHDRKPARIRLRPFYTRTERRRRAWSDRRLARRAIRHERWEMALEAAADSAGLPRRGRPLPAPPAPADPAVVTAPLPQGGDRS